MRFVDLTAGSLCSPAHDLFRDTALGPSLFFLCRVTGVRSSTGFICVEKCHLAQAAKALSGREERGGGGHRGEIICACRCSLYLLTSQGWKRTTDKLEYFEIIGHLVEVWTISRKICSAL